MRRNVISTRVPTRISSGEQSVSSQLNRPPPSKSIAAVTTGGGSEYASRSTVYVDTVPCREDIGSASIASTAAHPAQTRCGGTWTREQLRQRLPTKPYFQSAARWAGGPSGRAGSGRRGGSRRSTPRQVRKVA